MTDFSDFLFSLPNWLVYGLVAGFVLACVAVIAWCCLRAADRKVDEAFAPVPSVADDFAAMGEQAESVAWIFGDERPRLTVIDGGEGTAA